MAAELPQLTALEAPGHHLGLSDTDSSAAADLVVEIPLSESPKIAPDGGDDESVGAVVMAEVAEESAATDDEDELRNAIERDLCRLTIELTEIEAASERSDAAAGVEEGEKDEESGEKDNLDEDKDGKGADTDENENEGSVGGNSWDSAFKLERFNQSYNRSRINYPMRPDAEDCAFYMKFGSCKFGTHCKFNHPPRKKNQGLKERADYKDENPERAGQTRCKYYLTSEGCKYGSVCKYYHGTDKLAPTQALNLNFLGLPIRPGEKECPYYMRTGSCKYGSTCRFHHPEPTTVGGGDSPSGYGNDIHLPLQHASLPSPSSWSSRGPSNETSAYVPIAFAPTQSAPTSHPLWNGHKASFNPTLEKSLPTPPAFAINNQLTENYFPMQHHNHMMGDEYPERPGEPECSFFMKTGDCKFKSNCKFHHPKHRFSRATPVAFNDKGLPLRPDQSICSHYQRYGICKYGPACKYDHPSHFSVFPPPFSNSNMVQGATGDG